MEGRGGEGAANIPFCDTVSCGSDQEAQDFRGRLHKAQTPGVRYSLVNCVIISLLLLSTMPRFLCVSVSSKYLSIPHVPLLSFLIYASGLAAPGPVGMISPASFSTAEKYLMVSFSPSSTLILGSQPISRFAVVISGLR